MATTAKFPKIICRVKALYAFSSTEKSSLSFEKDEYIEVLSQLDSGWWDGWCKGNRGWFPSNYVEIIDVNPDLVSEMNISLNSRSGRNSPTSPAPFPPSIQNNDDDSEEEARTINLIRNMNNNSTSNTPMTLSRPHSLTLANNKPATPPPRRNQQRQQQNIQEEHQIHTIRPQLYEEEEEEEENDHTNLPEGWTLQIADDGLTKFYFNQQTGGLRWNHPGISDSDSDDDEDHDDSSGDEDYIQGLQSPQQNIHPTRRFDHFEDYDFGKSDPHHMNDRGRNHDYDSLPPTSKEPRVNVSQQYQTHRA